MTRALHELIDTGREIDTSREIDEHEARILEELNQQFKATTEQIAEEHAASPEDIEDIREAREVLDKKVGHIALSELVEMMDAAVASNDPKLGELAHETLLKRFPQDVSDPGIARANIRSAMDYEKAIELAREKNTLVSEQIAQAAIVNDEELGADFDKTIAVGEWTVLDREKKLDEATKQKLDEYRNDEAKRLDVLRQREKERLDVLRQREKDRLDALHRREEERKKLEATGEIDNEDFDDAVKYDPFADDDDEDETA